MMGSRSLIRDFAGPVIQGGMQGSSGPGPTMLDSAAACGHVLGEGSAHAFWPTTEAPSSPTGLCEEPGRVRPWRRCREATWTRTLVPEARWGITPASG